MFTIPVMLSLVLGSAAGLTSFNAMDLFRNLVTAVLLPLMAGAATQALLPGGQGSVCRSLDLRGCGKARLA